MNGVADIGTMEYMTGDRSSLAGVQVVDFWIVTESNNSRIIYLLVITFCHFFQSIFCHFSVTLLSPFKSSNASAEPISHHA
jgi:hypothetical protein